MNSKIYTLITAICLFISLTVCGQQKNTNQNLKQTLHASQSQEEWYNKAIEKLDILQSSFTYQVGSWQAINPKNKLHFTVDGKKYKVSDYSSASSNNIIWEGGSDLQNISRQSNSYDLNGLRSHSKDGNLEFGNSDLIIQYENGTKGLRQNFILNKKLPGNGVVSIDLALNKSLQYKLGNKTSLCGYIKNEKKEINSKLFYDDLNVWDANGKELAAQFQLDPIEKILSIEINDANAVYPITVDPLSHTPEWTTSADGVLPGLLTNLQLQIDALYGYNVAGLGDVNGDGFDDVAIGAPGAIDVIGATTIVGAGAVFVYFGSSTGLPTTPSKVLRSNTPVVNALFGFSIAGGNITGTSRNDIAVGAPGETYTATVSAPLGTTTASVTAGKVYVFDGTDLDNATPSPLLSVFLDGTGFFSSGIAGFVGANISVDALFGFSVGIADDVTSDGLGELVVGSPGYAALELLPVRSGAAFVFNSQNLSTNTPTTLFAPTTSLLGIPLVNTAGLLFGFSVDGMGDYNQDGLPDVVVGAPGGALITGGNILGGSAYIYYGTPSTGITPAIGAKLSGQVSLGNLLPDLFGFSVRGLKNANGTHNGNVIVGAPVSSALSNVLNGLKLKTGTLNVFTHNFPPSGYIQPDQIINSPRGNSLLSILALQNIDVSALYGASIDNMLDVNCDGINDIIVGEPLSTGVGIINANVVGGAAYVLLGKADGTFITTPYFTLVEQVSQGAGINAGSLIGYSVAGGRHTNGIDHGVRAIVGAPGAALDFSTGIFNLNPTLNTLFSFVAGNNGLGKAYGFAFQDCDVEINPDINVTLVNVSVPGNVKTNDGVPVGTTYGTPIPVVGNPPGGMITMNGDGTYSFVSPNVGVYVYNVPVCVPGQVAPCPTSLLTITVLDANIANNPPVANTDFGITKMNMPITLNSLANDRAGNPGGSLDTASVMVTVNPLHGTTSVNAATGEITYTPATDFVGFDTLTYRVCDNSTPTPLCATALQIILVETSTTVNTTIVVDDYAVTPLNTAVSGNVMINDSDPEGDALTDNPQTTTVTGKGTLVLGSDGTYTFTPVNGFTGPVEFPYTSCDNAQPQQQCESATLHILVMPVQVLPVTLSEFTFQLQDCSINFRWTAEQDAQTNSYALENSADGITWKEISNLPAKSVGGLRQSYNFILNNAGKNDPLYRLVIYDKDGRKQYSNNLKAVSECHSQLSLQVFPNPFEYSFKVKIYSENKENAQITVSDITGRTVFQKKIVLNEGNNTIDINEIPSISSGNYYLNVRSNSGNLVQQIVKIK